MSKDSKQKEWLLHIANERLYEKYPYGLYDWLNKQDRGAYDEINRLENQINYNVLKNGTVEELKALLRVYWITHMKAIIEYKYSLVPGGA